MRKTNNRSLPPTKQARVNFRMTWYLQNTYFKFLKIWVCPQKSKSNRQGVGINDCCSSRCWWRLTWIDFSRRVFFPNSDEEILLHCFFLTKRLSSLTKKGPHYQFLWLNWSTANINEMGLCVPKSIFYLFFAHFSWFMYLYVVFFLFNYILDPFLTYFKVFSCFFIVMFFPPFKTFLYFVFLFQKFFEMYFNIFLKVKKKRFLRWILLLLFYFFLFTFLFSRHSLIIQYKIIISFFNGFFFLAFLIFCLTFFTI